MTIDLLEKNACLYWPADLAKEAAQISSLGPLLETQEEFIALLTIANTSPTDWKSALKLNRKLSPNLFLKHLMVLSDTGGERLHRFSRDLDTIFPERKFTYIWDNTQYEYKFQSGDSAWTNKNLDVEKSTLLIAREDFTPQMTDACMLLMWAGLSKNTENLPPEIMEKCIIGSLLGKANDLKKFITQRYIVVSRQTGGSTANDLGHICESYIKEKLVALLPESIEVAGHTIPNVTHNEKNLSTFDLVAQCKNGTHIGIEISFQVTTNSTIERKAGLAKSRKDLVHAQGHKIAYIIDGSGNFQRRNAITTILNNSDCTVNFSDGGLKKLAAFIIKASK